MRKHLRYALYLLKHKWYVYQFGKGLGLGWFGLLHDNSKFLPSEWFSYADNFYGDRSAPGVKERFDAAWLNHQRGNKHHWQWWVTVDSKGHQRVLPMPDRYRREMLADWMGAGLAITGRVDVVNWYRNNMATIVLHPETRDWIEARLGLNAWHVDQDPIPHLTRTP